MIQTLIIIIAPLILSNIFHMWVVKKDLLSRFKRPLARELLGENKTWRGLLILPFFNGIFALLICPLVLETCGISIFFKGFLLGLTYLIFELPNSFLKRKAGIAPGASSEKHPVFFSLLDKTDSSFGVALVSMPLFGLGFGQALTVFLVGSLAHIFFSWLLVLFKIKARF